MRPGNAIAALFYLRITSLRNAVIARVARLREPKYLVGAIVGVAYVYWLVFGRADLRRVRGAAGIEDVFPLERLPAVAAIAALLLTVFVVLYWLWPRSRAALTFSEAEIAFLFPAPISRKTLIHFRWISTQLRILFTSLLLGLVSAGWTFVPGSAALRIVGFWLLLSTLDLHVVGASFTLTRLLDRGMTSRRRGLLTLAAAAVVTAAALAGTWRALRLPAPGELGSAAALMDYVAALLATVPLAWLITPARWIVQPLLAPDFRAFVAALGPALLVYAVHYIWVLHSEVSFEEASLAKAEKRAARRSAIQLGTIRFGERKAQRAPFKLTAAGRPEIAFLWKNLLASASYLQRPRAALIAATAIVIGSFVLARLNVAPFAFVVTMLAVVGAAYTLVFGPMVARQDLRHDLPNADILKTYPLQGWQIVLGEILAPITIVTVLLWLQLLTAALN
jgi:ABC-2 type transport system permease protein